jgi:uncharacterized protein
MENNGLKVLVHASAFFMPFLVPFIIYLVIDDLEVKRMAVQAILFQLVMGALIIVSTLLILVIIGIPMLIGFGLMWLIVPIIAIVKALNGEPYNYPIVGRWI